MFLDVALVTLNVAVLAKQVVAVALNDYVDKYSLCISLCLLVSFVWSLSH